MPRTAKTDTYATETTYGVPVQRFVRAGDVVPDAWEVDAKDVEDVPDSDSEGVTASETTTSKRSKKSDA